MHFLHALDVKIQRICERVGDFSRAECFGEFANRIFDGESWGIAEFAEDFIRGNVVGAIVVGGSMGDFDLASNDLANLLSNGVEGKILVTGIENFAVNLSGRQGEAFHIKFGAVGNVKIGPKLTSAKNGDFPFVDGMIGQNIHREVETKPRRPTANGGGTER